MEAVAAAATIVQLVEVTGKALVSGYTFLARVHHAPAEIRALLREVANLNALLDQLQSLATDAPLVPRRETAEKDNLQNALQTLDSLGLFADCFKLMQMVMRTLQMFELVEGHQTKNLGKKILWPFKEKETRELMAQLGKLREALSAAVVVDSAKTLVELEKLAHRIDSAVIETLNITIKVETTTQAVAGDVGHVKKILQEGVEKEEYVSIRRWLFPDDTNPHAGLAAGLGSKRSETGRWLLESKQFLEWQENTSRCMWIYGIAGCGKTVISATAINHLQQSSTMPSTCVLHFFCDRRIPNMQSLQDLLYAIVKQLLDQNPTCLEDAKQRYHERTRGVEGPKAAARPFSVSEYIRFIQQLCLKWESVSLVVDAVDECSGLDTFVDGLRNLWSGANVRLLLTSRHDVDLKRAIEPIASYKIALVENMKNDIEIYLKTEIRKRIAAGTLKLKQKELEELIATALEAKADGMILIAKLQLEYISGLKSDRAIKEALIKLPSGIYETYDEILNQLFTKRPNDIEDIKSILKWLLCSRIPLTLQELAEAISIRAEDKMLDESGIATDIMDLAACCGSFVTVNTQATSEGQYSDLRGPQITLITFAHASVEEYFKSGHSGRGLASAFHMDMEKLHYELARTCVQYLGFEDFRVPLRDPSMYMKNMRPSKGTLLRHRHLLRSRTSKYALVDYASRYWADHLRLSNFSGTADSEMMHLLGWFITPPDHGGKYISWQQMFHHDISWYCQGRPPLFYAIQFQIDSLVRLLLQSYGDLNSISPTRGHLAPLHVAARYGALNITEELLRRGASVDLKSDSETKSMGALHFASEGGHAEEIKLLLKYGASVNQKSHSESTPFYRAARSGSLKSLKILYAAGSDINARTWDNFTPLFEAVAHGRIKTASQLLEWGADPTIVNGMGESALKVLARDRNIRLQAQRHGIVTEQDILHEIADIRAQGKQAGGFADYLSSLKPQYIYLTEVDYDARPGIERERDFRDPNDPSMIIPMSEYRDKDD